MTARRQFERELDIPGSVQATTGDELNRFGITDPTDIAKLVPGLTFSAHSPGAPTDIFLRGARWTATSGLPSIPIYINEASVYPLNALRTIFDIEQVEVLRGTQGTLRGEPSVTGAITFTTRKPNLGEIGGYMSVTVGEGRHRAVQGMLSLPIEEGLFAIRVAGSLDDTSNNQVRSLNNRFRPFARNRSWRVSARFEPTPSLRIDTMYQRLNQRLRGFQHVAGPGAPGMPLFGILPNFNSPALAVDDRLGVQVSSNVNRQITEFITVNAGWDVLGHKLEYNFGTERNHGFSSNTIDPANMLAGFDSPQTTFFDYGPEYRFHDLRLSSLRDERRFLNYDIGIHSRRFRARLVPSVPAALFPGALGNPFSSVQSPFVDEAAFRRYSSRAEVEVLRRETLFSAYANLLLNLTDKIELSGGIRWMRSRRNASNLVTISNGFLAAFRKPGGSALFDCGSIGDLAIVNSPVYPDICDVALPRGVQPQSSFADTAKPVIYHAVLTQRFSSNLLAYLSVGRGWRGTQPPFTTGGLPDSVFSPDPEVALTYELGVKATLKRWLQIEASVFQVKYDGQYAQFGSIPFYDNIFDWVALTNPSFFFNVDSRIRGIETSLRANPTPRLSATAGFSYVKVTSRGTQVPCRDDSRPLTPENPINFCPSEKGQVLNGAPPFQASFSGEYRVPVGSFEGYLRLLAAHRGKSPNFGTSIRLSNAHTLVDLFAGISHAQRDWEIGFYAKNLFNKSVELGRGKILAPLGLDSTFGPTGLDSITTTLPRELGLALKFAIGSS